MDIGFNTLNNIGSNYYVKLNDKEVLIYEDEENTKSKTIQKKQLAKDEEKKINESNKLSQNELSEDEERLVIDLQARDSEVRAHESAHQAAGGTMTGAATFTYQQGPDGKMYAIGGEVSISMRSGSTPEETIANAQQIIASAMAAGNPSPQDHAVAASAKIIQMKATQQLDREEQEKLTGHDTYSNVEKNEKQDNNINISA